jgi:hypothetical protein
MHSEYVSIQGPVEQREGQLVLRVPLEDGGHRLRTIARAVSFVENGDLVVLLPEWLAERMDLREGTTVHVDDRWGKLNISRLN